MLALSPMYVDNHLETVHLEMTDKCNASCPQCARNKLGGVENPYLKQTELKLEDIQKIFPPHLVGELKRLYMCGNYGDPIVAKDTLEAFCYFRQHNADIKLSLNTNGSLQNRNWWQRLAQVIGKKGDVKFGIDGLEDTHHLYRRKTQFATIIDNAQAFIEAGGQAVWEFIVFRHNEHQVEEARRLAHTLSFSQFTVKKTGRFFSNQKLGGKEQQEVCDKKGSIEYHLEKPLHEKYQNKSLEKEQQIISQFGSMHEYLNQTPIRCKVAREKSVYVSAEGLVFPCCWTANQMYLWYFPREGTPIWQFIKTTGGKEAIDAKKIPVKKIVRGDFFKKIKTSWSCQSLEQGKLKVCAKTCGTLFDQFKDQYQ